VHCVVGENASDAITPLRDESAFVDTDGDGLATDENRHLRELTAPSSTPTRDLRLRRVRH